MSLYLLFETATGVESGLPNLFQRLVVQGFSFSSEPLKKVISVPGERDVPVRCLFYAQNYFRIYISDLVMEFYHETSIVPTELLLAEKHIRSAVLGKFSLRRWVITSEEYDDDDNRMIRIISEGSNAESLNDATADA